MYPCILLSSLRGVNTCIYETYEKTESPKPCMIKLRINISKIDETMLFPGKNGKYLNLLLFENKDGRDSYGSDGFSVQELSKEQREAGTKGPIVGNWKHQESNPPQDQPN